MHSQWRRVGRWLSATAMVVLSLCIGLGLVEGLTRAAFPSFDPSGHFDFDYPIGALMLGHPGARSRQVKNTGDFDVAVRINRYGLRDAKDVAQARPEDLVFVGDSFTWGWGVEEKERFSNLVEARTGIRSFNVSTPTDIAGYQALLAYAQSLGAKVGRVVIAICMENDLRRYSAEEQPDTDAPDYPDIKDWLEHHSAAFLLTATVVHRTPWLTDLAVRAGLVIRNFDGMSRNEYSPGIVESSADAVLEIARQYRTLVVIIPSRGLWVGPNKTVEDRVHRLFVSALVRRGIDVLDLRPLFEAGGQPLAYHFANDAHWTPQGHALAAAAIAKRLGQKD
jgi:hypothetical protein